MLPIKKSLVVSSLILLAALSTQLYANQLQENKGFNEKSQAQEGTLKGVMQGLLKNTQGLTAALLTEDFANLEKFAKKIADHPKVGMATRMKLMQAMGTEMAKFKANDDVVHNAAVNMIKNSQQKDIKALGENFQVMIGGCIACHGEFKAKVSAILK